VALSRGRRGHANRQTVGVPQRPCPVIVGREAELSALRRALTTAVSGEAKCALLVGEAGIGKSRLAQEVADWAVDQGARVVTGRAVPASASTAYRPITDFLLQLFRHMPLPDDPGLVTWLPLLQPLLPHLVKGGAATADIPPNLRGEAVVQLLGRVSSSALAIVVEDLHWADGDTLALLEYLADNLSGPALLVLTLRDDVPSAALEVARRLRSRAGVTFVSLGRLTDEQQATMVRACQPDADERLVGRIQATAEGVPFLVEELLASPGLPADFRATVEARLAALGPDQREVIEAAAVLGRHFDWQLLPAMTGQGEEAVSRALAEGVGSMLLASHGPALSFWHALTREAVLDQLIPPRQRQLALSGLDALANADPALAGGAREVAIDLALRAGDRRRAGQLLIGSGRQSLAWGALATAAEALRRAADLLVGSSEQAEAELELLEALALSGRVDEAAAVGARMVTRLGSDLGTVAIRLEAHLQLAHAAVAASRWPMARCHLDEARRLTTMDASRAAGPRVDVLEADLAMAVGDYETARAFVEGVLVAESASAAVRCHAFEVLGRSRRSTDLSSARVAFEGAQVTAENADLPLWRLRALHELGTIDLFDHAGVSRLQEARRSAEQMGAMSTAAVLDLQLCAAFTCRWDLDACDAHAASALEVAERLGLGQVRAKALAMLTGSASMRADLAGTEKYATLTVAAAPEDQMLQGFCWGMRGMALLLTGDADASVEAWSRGMAILGRVSHAEPAALRALWPLVLATRGDRRAQEAIHEARSLGVAAFHLNRSIVAYAEAVLAGRQGDKRRAQELIAIAGPGWANCEGWADLARLLAAPAALSDGWADARLWLNGASARFTARGLPELGRQCRELLSATTSNPWSDVGISAREADVLRLVAEGLSNKDIADRLYLSPRTVEKHIESLFRKTGARSRTQLLTWLAPAGGSGRKPASPGVTA
jgi:DNA-binding CsgD family transcriptional regulator